MDRVAYAAHNLTTLKLVFVSHVVNRSVGVDAEGGGAVATDATIVWKK